MGRPIGSNSPRPFHTASLVPGEGYVLRFFAKADEPTSFRVVLMNRDQPWNNLGLSREVAVDSAWKSFRLVFRARQSDQTVGKVNFFLGEAKGTVWIDGLAIAPYDPKSVEPDGPTLDTDAWSLTFFRTGAIAKLVHKPTERVLIEPSEGRRAYELTLSKDTVDEKISSDEAESIRFDPLPQSRGYRFVARHPNATVAMTYAVDEATGLIACRSEVENASDAAVTRWCFRSSTRRSRWAMRARTMCCSFRPLTGV